MHRNRHDRSVPQVPSGYALVSQTAISRLFDTPEHKSQFHADYTTYILRLVVHSSKDDVFGHVTHTVARGALFDSEMTASCNCLPHSTLYILELPYAPGPR